MVQTAGAERTALVGEAKESQEQDEESKGLDPSAQRAQEDRHEDDSHLAEHHETLPEVGSLLVAAEEESVALTNVSIT